jgi:hypothetical protein
MESLLLSKRLRATCELSSKARRGRQTGTTRVRAYLLIGNVRSTSLTSFSSRSATKFECREWLETTSVDESIYGEWSKAAQNDP